jgi:hypothetical protein
MAVRESSVQGEGEGGVCVHVMQECVEHIEPVVGLIELRDGRGVRLSGTNAATHTRSLSLGANHPRARSRCTYLIKCDLFCAL